MLETHGQVNLERLRGALASASFETTARPSSIEAVIQSGLPSGSSIYITRLPNDRESASLDAAIRLRRAGCNPVPHIAARHFSDLGSFEDLLRRLTSEAGVDQVLLIGGDVDQPRGPFRSSLDLLNTGLFERLGIRRVGIAGYPEGHPRIAANILDQVLAAKIKALRQAGLSPYVVTQFCFAADPISNWLARFGKDFADIPVHVGLAAPASISTLVRYGMACGVGASLRGLQRNMSLRDLLRRETPNELLRELNEIEKTPTRIERFHFFTFGGIKHAVAWLRATLENRNG